MRRRWTCGVLLAATLGLPLGCGGSGGGPGEDGMLSGLFPLAPSEVARDAFNVYDPDKRRRAVNRLASAEWGGESPYLKTYRMLAEDPDPTVRAAALRALGKHGAAEDALVILPCLEDENSFVRWEAARSLQRLHHEDAIDPLLAALRQDEEPNVRQAAADALGQYPRSRVFQALVGALNDESYSVIHQAERSLGTLTGQDLGQDGGMWLAWAEGVDDLFAERRAYYYPQFVRPPGLADRLRFWEQPEGGEPRQPRGQEIAENGEG